ncbi:MAG: BamA/TamA family outer membrane protein [Gammaproteobacteria bacterium]|nr:BamA/TamA family outer membrane protein [Gammaproteobacteria bacterium]
MHREILSIVAIGRHAGVALAFVTLWLAPASPLFADAAINDAAGIAAAQPPLDIAPAVLEASGARIGSITIDNGGIFDLDNPDENKPLYRLANRVHMTTRPEVIQQQLLFDTGDLFSEQSIQETERILRSNRYIQTASIEPVRAEDGIVDLQVKTTDVWTLVPRLGLSRSGGETSSSFGIKETNLFGTGMEVEALYESDVDRDSHVLKIVDHNFHDSWYGLTAFFESNSDGYKRLLDINRPFYSLNSRSAHGLTYLDEDRIDSLYDRGDQVAAYRHRVNGHKITAGWSAGLVDGWSRRYSVGLAYDEHRFSTVAGVQSLAFSMPENRRLAYPFIGIELLQDKFGKSSNLDQISVVEDRFLGTSINARLGLSQTAFGADRNAWLASVNARTSFGNPQSAALFLASQLATRLESGEWTNLTFEANARYYRRVSEKRLFFAKLSGTYGHNLDLDQHLLLGGDSGLRGYPLRYQMGDKRMLLTLEQRVFTDWYPWRLLRVGGAVFFDAGRTWGQGPIPVENHGLLKDVGIGLRLGNPRSGLGNVAHIDLAFPLDAHDDISDLQFLVSIKKSF